MSAAAVDHKAPLPTNTDRPAPHDPKPDDSADADYEVDDVSASKPKKKRRVVKTSDKKFECPQPDCGKSYSRAEHLYRHQLNRKPCPKESRGDHAGLDC